MRKTAFQGFALTIALAGLLAGCGNNGTQDVTFNPVAAQPVATATPFPTPFPTPIPFPSATPAPVTQVQVEQLARPTVAEATLVTNAFLNTYNAVGPAFIAAALANATSPQGQAAGPVLAESVGTLTAFASANTTLKANPSQLTAYVNGLVGALLPDVMRIDTNLNVALAATAFTASVNSVGSPCGGRKITDDVMDVVLTLATASAVTSDGVPYYRPATPPGSLNQNIGHQNLNGQTTPFGAATFPYLAPAN